MILAADLIKRYGHKEVLRGLSLEARPGEITILVGENGAGKSTTMRILAGLAAPDGGSAAIGGHHIVQAKLSAQRALSYLPQNPDFHPRLTCLQLLNFYARLRGVKKARIDFVLKEVGLTSVREERAGALSGGMRQRLGIALLLLPDAPVLLLDEPGLSLDPAWRNRLQAILLEEAARAKTILMATHLIAEWNAVAQRCLLCHAGRIERELDPNDLPNDFDMLAKRGAAAPGSACASHAREDAFAFTNFSSATHVKDRFGEAPKPAGEGARAPRAL
ncbi:MAG: ABC transporter ATP-binding protein [Spartobacteria bacterium]